MRTKASRKKSHRAGLFAEYVALCMLLLKGYLPVALRYKTPVGEIDLIVKHGSSLVFVEVKGRKNAADAAQAVHAKNQSRVVRAAQYFLSARPALAGCDVRFDVCLVPWYRLPQHIPHAFEAS